ARLPGLVKGHLGLMNVDRAKALSATQVVDAVHSDHLRDPACKIPLSADHGITRNEPGESRLFPILRALRSLRQDDIAQLSCTVPGTHSDFIRQANPEFIENTSPVPYRSRAVCRHLGPVWRHSSS